MASRVRSWVVSLGLSLATLWVGAAWALPANAADANSRSRDEPARSPGSVQQSRNASFPAPSSEPNPAAKPDRAKPPTPGEGAKEPAPKKTSKPKAAKKTPKKQPKRAAKKKRAKAPPAKSKTAKAKQRKPAKPRWVPPPPVELTETERALKEALQLTVHERGPFKPWAVTVRNVGERPAVMASDSRLLWLEVTVPGRSTTVTCRLPDTMSPKALEDAAPRHLSPGAALRFRVDPRLYCFESGDQTLLVPGAFVRVHFGWPEKTVTRWRNGQRHQDRVEQKPPFFARFAEDPVGGRERPRRPEGLKAVQAEGLALSSDYIAWSRARPDDEPPRHRDLELAITYASDARAPRDVTVKLQLTNHGSETTRVYFRRDLLSFIVRAPDGLHECGPAGAPRAPDVQGFTRLGPGQSTSVTTRLFEFCPSEAFTRPGLYYVGAHLHAIEDGAEYGVDAFTGRLATRVFRPLRLHTGELPFLTRRRTAGAGGAAFAVPRAAAAAVPTPAAVPSPAAMPPPPAAAPVAPPPPSP